MAFAVLTPPDDPFVPFTVPRACVPPATHFRSTWLGSSLQALRARGHFDRYITHVPSEHRATILESVAGVWLPVGVCVAHYRACDALGLSKREAWDVGLEVTRRVHGTSLGIAFRLSKQVGVTPWSVLARVPQLWERVWRGGGVAVHKRGPKEAILEAVGWPLSGVAYVQHSMPAVVEGVVELFCTKAYVTVVGALTSETSIGLRLQWA